MSKPIVSAGQQYGHLIVVMKTNKKGASRSFLWKCRCECGRETEVNGSALTSGNTRSCGCMQYKNKKGRSSCVKPGETYHSLTIIQAAGKTSNGKLLWECRCICGNIRAVIGSHLKNGNTKSCGCRRIRDRDQHSNWKGHKDISGTYWTRIRAGCRRGSRTLSFSITKQYAWDLFEAQGRRCRLTGLPIGFPPSNSRGDSVSRTASLDRIDSNKGYTPGNVQWVHRDVNKMKQEFGQDHFIKICGLVWDQAQRENRSAV